jgi:sugar lactone lactonase YvrE
MNKKSVSVVVAAGLVLAMIGFGSAAGRKATTSTKRPLNRAIAERLYGENEPVLTNDQWTNAHVFSKVGDAGDESSEAFNIAKQFAQARTAPGTVAPGAYGAAYSQITALPSTAGTWTEVTNKPYDSDDPNYRDPEFSNSSGGSGVVTGRITGIAVDGVWVYAAGADGGVFRSSNSGSSWTPIADQLPTLSVGDLRLAPDGALWLATGEGNTGATSYVGTGVYRLAAPRTTVFTGGSRVGGNELESTFINKIKFDDVGHAYAATSNGLWRHSAGASGVSTPWTSVFKPNPGSTDPYQNIVNDVEVQPGTGGNKVLANAAWRGGAAYNGFYVSKTGGGAGTFSKVTKVSGMRTADIGNTEFAYAGNGSKLYAVVESIHNYLFSKNTALGGVYVSKDGSVDGPWSLVADSGILAKSGSALAGYSDYAPGVQAWYNNFIAVDPANPAHVFVGLEEVYESKNGGSTWTTPGPYWNFEFACHDFNDALNTCPDTTHSDQHSIAFGGGKMYVGNDGGLYRRPINGAANADGHATDWESLNSGLRTLQYYGVGVGAVPGGYAVAGGLQDNGGSLLLPGSNKMVSPFGGDGGAIVVDPDNGCNILDEYVGLDLWMTNTCGRSDGSFSSVRDVAPGDPAARFIAPFMADETDKNYLVAGGQYVWTYPGGFSLQQASDWTNRFDQGAGHATTALASRNKITYAAWCGPCNNDGFARGISTNYGGTWHQLTLPSTVPNRYISGLAIDPSDASGKTMYVSFNGFSRAWTEGPGAGVGHLYRTTNGGASWINVTGNLPDVPAGDIVITGAAGARKITLASDLGVYRTDLGSTTWQRMGTGLPLTTVMDLSVAPDGNIYAATHGRGLWKIPK